MTTYRGEARDIDNSKLLGLRSGRLFVTPLSQFVSWEGFGERAFLILNERRPGLKGAISQPVPRRYVSVAGKLVRYTADYELIFVSVETCSSLAPRVFREVWEVKSARALAEERWKEKLAAVEAQVTSEGKRFRVLDGTAACYSMELRTAEVLRLYRTVPITLEVEQWLRKVVEEQPVTVAELAHVVESNGLGRQHIYAALYLRILAVNEAARLNDQSLVTKGHGRLWQDTGLHLR